MQEEDSRVEPVKKRLGGSLAKKSPFERLAMLQRNADALMVRSWRGKDDGTLVKKVVGKKSEH